MKGEIRKIGIYKIYLSGERLESGALRFWKDVTVNRILARTEELQCISAGMS